MIHKRCVAVQPQAPGAGGGDAGGGQPGCRGVSHRPGHPGAHHPGTVPLSYCYSEPHTARSSHPLPTQPSHGDHCLTARHTALSSCTAHPALSWGPLSYSETHSSLLMPYPSTAHPALMGTIVMLLLWDTHSSLLMPYPSTAHPALMGTIVMLLLWDTHSSLLMPYPSTGECPPSPLVGTIVLQWDTHSSLLMPYPSTGECPPSPLVGTIVLQWDTHSSLLMPYPSTGECPPSPLVGTIVLQWDTHSSLLMPYLSTDECPPSPLVGTIVLQWDTHSSLLMPYPSTAHPKDHCLTVRHTQLTPHAPPIHCLPSPTKRVCVLGGGGGQYFSNLKVSQPNTCCLCLWNKDGSTDLKVACFRLRRRPTWCSHCLVPLWESCFTCWAWTRAPSCCRISSPPSAPWSPRCVCVLCIWCLASLPGRYWLWSRPPDCCRIKPVQWHLVTMICVRLPFTARLYAYRFSGHLLNLVNKESEFECCKWKTSQACFQMMKCYLSLEFIHEALMIPRNITNSYLCAKELACW